MLYLLNKLGEAVSLIFPTGDVLLAKVAENNTPFLWNPSPFWFKMHIEEVWDFCHLTEGTQYLQHCCLLSSRESQGLLGAMCPFTVRVESEACRSIKGILCSHFKPYICCSFALTSVLLWYLFDAHYCDIWEQRSLRTDTISTRKPNFVLL